MSIQLRVAGAQMAVTRDIAVNVRTILRGIDFAAGEGAEVLVTPEGSLSGYRPDFDRQEAAGALEQVTARARERGVGLALGTCFVEGDGKCYNQIRFYERDGTYLGFHAKILRCSSLGAAPVGELMDYATVPLRQFEFRGQRVGGLICNDMWANPEVTTMPDPHLSQQHAQAGARVIFHAVNGGRGGSHYDNSVIWPFHASNLRMRASAGKLWIVTVDNCDPVTVPCSAPSGVLDPKGRWAYRAPEQGEHFFAWTLELQD